MPVGTLSIDFFDPIASFFIEGSMFYLCLGSGLTILEAGFGTGICLELIFSLLLLYI
jgi:hypothetical protein